LQETEWRSRARLALAADRWRASSQIGFELNRIGTSIQTAFPNQLREIIHFQDFLDRQYPRNFTRMRHGNMTD
jgi:hypothetical protein